MPGSGPGDLYALARELLDACVEAAVLTPGGPFPQAFVSPGAPAWDCSQITVHAGGPVVADTMPLVPPLQPGRRDDVGSVNLVILTVTTLRCLPTVESNGQVAVMPFPSALDQTAELTLGDVWGIWQHLRHRYHAKTLFTRPDGVHKEFFFDPAVPVPIAGGLGGWQMQFRVSLEGYPPS